MNVSYNYLLDKPQIKIELEGSALWKRFHRIGTEMIITKNGRRMFPALKVKISGLEPSENYCLLLEFASTSNCRFKYSTSTGWASAGSDEVQRPQRIYVHPESPATGEHWMSQPITFGRAKLTNSVTPPYGQIVLSSMHKYQPRVIIVKSTNPAVYSWGPTTTTTFVETQFIAVTAYQNEEITKLKIDNNPFAKGFRDYGQGRCKRKRREKETINVEEDIRKNLSNDQLSPASERSANETSFNLTFNNFSSSYTNRYSYPLMAPAYYFPTTYRLSWNSFYNSYTNLPSLAQPSTVVYPVYPVYPSKGSSKKLTDFSIKAITGL